MFTASNGNTQQAATFYICSYNNEQLTGTYWDIFRNMQQQPKSSSFLRWTRTLIFTSNYRIRYLSCCLVNLIFFRCSQIFTFWNITTYNFILILIVSFLIAEHRDWIGSTPASDLEGPGFEYQKTNNPDWSSWCIS
jgi:hypothetical protein